MLLRGGRLVSLPVERVSGFPDKRFGVRFEGIGVSQRKLGNEKELGYRKEESGNNMLYLCTPTRGTGSCEAASNTGIITN